MIKVFSFGGGRQSTAVMVLQARGLLQFDEFVFCNVGDDSENPDTLDYIKNVTVPYCHQHKIKFTVLNSSVQGFDSLYKLSMSSKRVSPLPMFLQSGAPANRLCTSEFKIRRVAKHIKQLGATKKYPATVGIGISLDEYQRMRNDSKISHEILSYPLIDLKKTLSDCIAIIKSEGLPEPPKSSCFFCPFHSMETWRVLKLQHPDLFDKCIALEQRLNEKRESWGKDKLYLTRKLRPLDQVIGEQGGLFEDVCESGYCMV